MLPSQLGMQFDNCWICANIQLMLLLFFLSCFWRSAIILFHFAIHLFVAISPFDNKIKPKKVEMATTIPTQTSVSNGIRFFTLHMQISKQNFFFDQRCSSALYIDGRHNVFVQHKKKIVCSWWTTTKCWINEILLGYADGPCDCNKPTRQISCVCVCVCVCISCLVRIFCSFFVSLILQRSSHPCKCNVLT